MKLFILQCHPESKSKKYKNIHLLIGSNNRFSWQQVRGRKYKYKYSIPSTVWRTPTASAIQFVIPKLPVAVLCQ